MSFNSLGLNDELCECVEALGYVTPTPIQEKSIPILLSETTDFIGLAATGTGKTAAFSLPLIQVTEKHTTDVTGLIICPTRELCLQIVREIELFKKPFPSIKVTAVYGGSSIVTQISAIKRGSQIVVATPGRLMDLMERRAISLDKVSQVILDEADEMLNMGFREDIELILKQCRNRKSIWLFSATMSSEVRQVAGAFMEKPMEVTIGNKNTATNTVDHQYYLTSHQQRFEVLKRLVDFCPEIYGLIFVRTRIEAQEITEKLVRDGYDVDALHGDLGQAQRDKVMGAFRTKAIRLLIATDVAARGIDVVGITHVINYELPDEPEVYTHRSGRTGRAGETGICMNIVTPREESTKLKRIQKLVKNDFHKLEIPDGKDVCRKQFFHFVEKINNSGELHGDFETYIPLIEEKFANISKTELLRRFAALEFDRFLRYYENAGDLNYREENRRERREPGKKREYNDPQDTVRLFINVGLKDGFYKASFLQFILDLSGLKKDVLGRIDLKDKNSYVEIDKKFAGKMLQSLDGKTFKGRKVRMNEAD
jgi:ATP-dependent RNA helicase DeaD